MKDQPGPQTDPAQDDSLRNYIRGLLDGWNSAQDGDDPLHIQADELEVNLDHGDDSVAVYGETSGGSPVVLQVDSDGHLQVDILGQPLDVSAATVTVQEASPMDVSAAVVSVQEDTPLDVSAAAVDISDRAARDLGTVDVANTPLPVQEQGASATAGTDTTGASGGSAALNGGASLTAAQIVIEADGSNGAAVLVGIGGTNVLELAAGERLEVPLQIADVSNVTVESTDGNQQTVHWIAS